MSIPIIHHYLPQFFMQPWTRADGKVVEYKRPHIELLEERSTPKQTGFIKHLYANENRVDPAEKQALESCFMQRIDGNASDAHKHLRESSNDDVMPNTLRNAWTQFMMSLLWRSPDRVEYLNGKIATGIEEERIRFTQDDYNRYRGPNDPSIVEEWLNFQGDMRPELRVELIKMLISSDRIGNVIAQMNWGVIQFPNPRFGFLIGDLPMVISDGLENEKSFVLLAISPKDLFVAAASRETIEYFRSQPQKALETAYNDACVRQSRHVIIAANDAQRTFISKRFLKVGVETGANGLATWNNPLLGW